MRCTVLIWRVTARSSRTLCLKSCDLPLHLYRLLFFYQIYFVFQFTLGLLQVRPLGAAVATLVDQDSIELGCLILNKLEFLKQRHIMFAYVFQVGRQNWRWHWRRRFW